MRFKNGYLLGVAHTSTGNYMVECKFEAHTGAPYVTQLNSAKCLLPLDDVPAEVAHWVRINGPAHA